LIDEGDDEFVDACVLIDGCLCGCVGGKVTRGRDLLWFQCKKIFGTPDRNALINRAEI
jgi:hypothetical protein